MLMPLLEMYRRGKLLEQKTSGICSLEREFQTCVREGVLETRRSRRINVGSVNLVGIRSCMVRQYPRGMLAMHYTWTPWQIGKTQAYLNHAI